MLSGTANAYAKLRMNGASLVASCDRVGDSAVLYMNMSTHFLSGGSGVCWAFLYGVPVGCANKRLDEPCITLNTARPSLWSCTWTHGTVKEKSAGMAGVYHDVFEGGSDTPPITIDLAGRIMCPNPSVEFERALFFAYGPGTYNISLTVGFDNQDLPFIGLVAGNSSLLTVTTMPPSPPPPLLPPSSPPPMYASCKAYLEAGMAEDGLYTLKIGDDKVTVYCDQTSYGGGWTRVNKDDKPISTAENSAYAGGTYSQYTEEGFNTGDPMGSSSNTYWLPLKYWHVLLGSGGHFRTDTSKSDSETVWVIGATIASASDGFRLAYSGSQPGFTRLNGGSAHNGMRFTTKDKDQDTWSLNCASQNIGELGGFWHGECGQNAPTHPAIGLIGWAGNGHYQSDSVDYRHVYLRED